MSDESGRPAFRLQTINMDCHSALAMADFYGRLLGWPVTYGDDEYILMENPAGGTGLSFQREDWYRPPVWPEEPGALTKMIHLDIGVDDLDAAVAVRARRRRPPRPSPASRRPPHHARPRRPSLLHGRRIAARSASTLKASPAQDEDQSVGTMEAPWPASWWSMIRCSCATAT